MITPHFGVNVPDETILPVQKFLVNPGETNGITVIAPQTSTFYILSGDGDAPGPVLYVYADCDGNIQLVVEPSGELSDPATIILTDSDTANWFLVELYTNVPNSNGKIIYLPGQKFQGVSDGHITSAGDRIIFAEDRIILDEDRIRPSTSKMRNPLSEHEIKHLSNEELMEKGYPLRPDPVKEAKAYHFWRISVSQETTIITPHIISNPFLSCGPILQSGEQQSPVWCGFEIHGAAESTGNYNWVTGSWVVPSVTPMMGNGDCSAVWVGIDTGYGPNKDMIQAGTEQNCIGIVSGGVNISIYSYYAWYQILPPADSTQNVISNLPVYPGDQVRVSVWVGNNVTPLSPTLDGEYCFFLIENLTTAQTAQPICINKPCTIDGATAEWIVERPTLPPYGAIPPNYSTLASYQAFSMDGANAHNNLSPADGGALIGFNDAPNQYYMVDQNTGAILSNAVSGSDSGTDSIQFTWYLHGSE